MSTTTGQVPGGVALGVGVRDRDSLCFGGSAATPDELFRALGCDLEDCSVRLRAIVATLGYPSNEIGDFLSDRTRARSLSTLGYVEGRPLPAGAVPGARGGICEAGSRGGSIAGRLERHARFLRGSNSGDAEPGGTSDAAGGGAGSGDGPDLVSQIEAAKMKIQWLFSNVTGEVLFADDVFPEEGRRGRNDQGS